MATRRVFVVFVLPVIFSLIFGSVVLADILQKPDRELNGFSISPPKESPFHDSSIEIIGLSKQYSTSQPIEIQVKVNDMSFDCGDLYVTIYSSGKSNVITQGGFFEQCFEKGNTIIPIGDKFSKVIDTPGSYEIVTEMVSNELKNISTRGTFTIK